MRGQARPRPFQPPRARVREAGSGRRQGGERGEMLGLCGEAAHLCPSAPGGRRPKGLGPGLPGGEPGSSLRSCASLSLLSVCASASAVCLSVPLAPRALRPASSRAAVGPSPWELGSAPTTSVGPGGVAPGDPRRLYWAPGSAKPRPWSWGRAGPAPFRPGTGPDRPGPGTWMAAGGGGGARLPHTPLTSVALPLTPGCSSLPWTGGDLRLTEPVAHLGDAARSRGCSVQIPAVFLYLKPSGASAGSHRQGALSGLPWHWGRTRPAWTPPPTGSWTLSPELGGGPHQTAPLPPPHRPS